MDKCEIPVQAVLKSKCTKHTPYIKVAPGSMFALTFQFINVGINSWADDVQFKMCSDDEVRILQYEKIKAGTDFKVDLIAPLKPGKYFVAYRLWQNYDFFGEKAYVTIEVSNDKSSEEGKSNALSKAEIMLSKLEDKDDLKTSQQMSDKVEGFNDFPMQMVSQDPPKPEPIPAQTEHEKQVDEFYRRLSVLPITMRQYREKLHQLLDMGFVDFDKCQQVMLAETGNMENVINRLMTESVQFKK